MRRLLWLLLLLAPSLHAQVVGPGFVNYVTSAPSGTCSQGVPMQIVMGLGTVYTCQSGTWAAVGGGGGAPSGPAGGALAGTYPNPTLSNPVNIPGATSGNVVLTAPAIAGTSTNPLSISNVITLPTGNATSPAINMLGDLTTGFAQIDGTGSMSMISGGSRKHTWDASRYALVSDTANIQLGGSSDVNMSRGGAGIMDFGTGAAANTGATLQFTKAIPALGAVGTPSYTFAAVTTSGFYATATPAVVLTMGGVNQIVWAANLNRMVSGAILGWSSGDPGSAASDTIMGRGAAGVVDIGQGPGITDNGSLLTANLGRAALVGTDTAGATISPFGGLGTGNAAPGAILMDGGTKSTTSSSTAQTRVHRQVINDTKTLSNTNTTATTVLSLNVAAGAAAGTVIRYNIIAKSATDFCSLTGIVNAVAENTGGTIKSAVNASTGIGQATICTGVDTLAATFAITAANPAVISVTPVWATITPTSVYIIYNYDDLSDASSTL